MSGPKVYLETSFFRYLIATPSTDPRKADRQILRATGGRTPESNTTSAWHTVYVEFCDIALGKSAWRNLPFGRSLLEHAQLTPLVGEIIELATLLVEPKGPLPPKAETDAVHWAVAAHYGCEFVLTWNFKHLNNARIKRRAGKDHSRVWLRISHPLFSRGA